MNEKLDGVADTLYIPLVARIYASKRFPSYFYDEKALQLEKYISDEIIAKNSSEYFCMTSAARYYNLDRIVKDFLNLNSKCNVIYLGAGLDTAYCRIKNKTANFYQVDLPEVISLRKKLIGFNENEKLIDCDMFKVKWQEVMDVALPSIIVASGVFQYFHEEKIINFIKSLKLIFPRGYILFDATNTIGLRYANMFVKRTGNKNAQMYFSIDNSNDFAETVGIKLIEERNFFDDARKLGNNLRVFSRIAMKIADEKKRTKILYFRLN